MGIENFGQKRKPKKKTRGRKSAFSSMIPPQLLCSRKAYTWDLVIIKRGAEKSRAEEEVYC